MRILSLVVALPTGLLLGRGFRLCANANEAGFVCLVSACIGLCYLIIAAKRELYEVWNKPDLTKNS